MFFSKQAKKSADDDIAALKTAPLRSKQESPQQIFTVPKSAVESSSLQAQDFEESLGSFQPDFAATPRMGWQVDDKKMGEKFSDKVGTPLVLSEMHVSIVANVTSAFYKSTIIMTFINETDRVLEGELVFPLPERSTVCGFGLDVDNQLVDAVPVEKEVARTVFETEVRQSKDPGLIEHVSGNVFKTRVYPMPPHGTRSVKVVFVSELTQNEKFDSFVWHPFDNQNDKSKKPLKHFSYSIDVIGSTSEQLPKLLVVNSSKGAPKQLATLVPTDEPNRHSFALTSRGEYNPKDPISTAQGLLVVIPASKQDQVKKEAVIERDCKGNLYFAAQDFVVVPEEVTSQLKKESMNIGIIWDASFSRLEQNKSSEFALVEGLLQSLLSAGTKLSVMISLLHYQLDPPQEFKLSTVADVKTVLQFLQSVDYDGGTNLSALTTLFTAHNANQFDYVLLFTDGFGTTGPEKIVLDHVKSPIYCLGNSVKINSALLNFIAQKTGAQYFNLLNKDDKSLQRVISSIGTQVFSFLYAEASEEDALVDIVPSKPTPVAGRFVIAGRINPDNQMKPCSITLCFGKGTTVTRKVTFHLDPKKVIASEVLSIFWASRFIEELSAFPDLNKDALKHLGLEYGLVTPGTSLLVLETLEQHLKYNIAPAPSRAALRAEYDKQRSLQTQNEQKIIAAKLDNVYYKWKDRVTWFQTDFSSRQSRQSLQIGSSSYGSPDFENCAGDYEDDEDEECGNFDSAPEQCKCCCEDSKEQEEEAQPQKRQAKSCDSAEKTTTPAPRAAPSITIKSWDPQTPYIQAMKSVPKDKMYSVYLSQRANYLESPAFFFDCADFLFKQGLRSEALRVLTNIAEIQIENGQLIRIMGYKLHVEKALELAKYAFARVLKLRPEEPQSYRDLGLVHDDLKEYGPAMNLLWKVVTGSWDSRFDEIELTALVEFNRIIAIIKREKQYQHLVAKIPTTDSRFLVTMDFDLRFSLAWDQDMTDIDLHVLDPWGEDGYYGNKNTYMGGRLSRDFTQGYGPEEFMLKTARPGKFQAKTHYYANHQQSLSGGTTLLCSVFTNYARPNENKQMIALRLSENKESFVVAEIEWKE